MTATVPATKHCLTAGLRLPVLGHITFSREVPLTLPVWCKCGAIVTYSNEDRCEDCFVNDTVRYHGRSKQIAVPFRSAREELLGEQRGQEIRRLFQGAANDQTISAVPSK